jgi:hypothetical protein
VKVTWQAELVADGELSFRIGTAGDEVVAEWIRVARLVARRDGSGARLTALPGADPRNVEKIRRGSGHLLLRDLEGKLALHGAAVAVGERAVVLLGRSGQGKSTLAAALCRAGASLLADDAVALDPGPDPPDGGWLVLPQEIDHWLDRPAREALGLPSDVEGKDAVRTTRAGDRPARVVSFIELTFGEAPLTPTSLMRQGGIDAMKSLVPQVARFILDDPARQRRELDRLQRLIEAIPCRRLERPRELAHLNGAVDCVMSLLCGTSPPGL